MRGEAFVSAPGPSAVIRRSENHSSLKYFDLNCPPASTPGLEPPPFARGAPNACSRLLKLVDVRARATKMWGGARTRPEGVLLVCHDFHATVH